MILNIIFPSYHLAGSSPLPFDWVYLLSIAPMPCSHCSNSENSETFLGGCSKVTVDGDGSHEIRRCLFLGRKVMTNLDSILKSRDITLPTKVRLVKAMVFQWPCMDVSIGI